MPHGLDEVIKEFRNQLFTWLCLGTVTAAQIAIVSYYVTLLGAVGVEDLKVRPDSANHGNGSKKVKLVLGREFGDTNLHYVKEQA